MKTRPSQIEAVKKAGKTGANPAAGAFTLAELLTVAAVIAVLLALAMPVFSGIKTSGDLTRAAYDLAGLLRECRACAMADNTFVFVGFAEQDAAPDASGGPPAGSGMVRVAAVESRDGTRGYDAACGSLPSPAWSHYNNGANFNPVGALQHFDNLHLLPYRLPPEGGLKRPVVGPQYNLGGIGGSHAYKPVTPFAWPPGSSLDGKCACYFDKVIHFDPQGVARIQYKTNTDEIRSWMEIGLQPLHDGVPDASGSNFAVIQVNCMTGAARVFRP
jgi:hypothetical protein